MLQSPLGIWSSPQSQWCHKVPGTSPVPPPPCWPPSCWSPQWPVAGEDGDSHTQEESLAKHLILKTLFEAARHQTHNLPHFREYKHCPLCSEREITSSEPVVKEQSLHKIKATESSSIYWMLLSQKAPVSKITSLLNFSKAVVVPKSTQQCRLLLNLTFHCVLCSQINIMLEVALVWQFWWKSLKPTQIIASEWSVTSHIPWPILRALLGSGGYGGIN